MIEKRGHVWMEVCIGRRMGLDMGSEWGGVLYRLGKWGKESMERRENKGKGR